MTLQNLIIGASGQVGEHLLTALTQRGQSTVGTCYHHPRPAFTKLDLLDQQETFDLIQTLAPRTIYLPAALTNVDYCESHPEASYLLNVIGVQTVVKAAAAINARLVYFSSDYIFDGTDGPYAEDRAANPICVYGRHKLAAEHYVALHAPHALIIRTTVVFGWETQRKNFACRLVQMLSDGQPMRVPVDQIGNPTYGPDLAHATADLVAAEATGVFNVVGRDRVSRYDFALALAQTFGLNENLIQPIDTHQLNQRAPRPLNAGLTVAKAEHALGRPLPGYLAGAQAMYNAQGTSHVQ